MSFCREFKALPESGGYMDQPADTMIRWHEYQVVEGEALAMRRRIDEIHGKTKH